jgi:hypothetical protein
MLTGVHLDPAPCRRNDWYRWDMCMTVDRRRPPHHSPTPPQPRPVAVLSLHRHHCAHESCSGRVGPRSRQDPRVRVPFSGCRHTQRSRRRRCPAWPCVHACSPEQAAGRICAVGDVGQGSFAAPTRRVVDTWRLIGAEWSVDESVASSSSSSSSSSRACRRR